MKDIIKEVEQLLDNMREPGFILTRALVNEAKRQQAEIEKKDIEIDILIRKKEALKDEVSELRAEIERLQKKVDYLKDANKRNDAHLHVRLVEQAKSEAVKEFAKRLKAISHPYGDTQMVFELQIDNLVKEMVGDDNA